ncbi:MAG: hypothetical protein ACLFVQ_12745 [Chitinispirillaceae bacterium]
MRKLMLTFISSVALLWVAGCGGSVAWKVTDAKQPLASKNGYFLKPPSKWMVYEESGVTLLTRHGATMDLIQIKKIPVLSPMPHTTMMIDSSMQVYEVAEVVISNLRAGPGIYDLDLEEMSPASIDGKEGFLIRFSYALDNGLTRRCFVFGFVSGGWYHEIGYYALKDFYYDNSLDAFLNVVESFSLL